MALYKKKKKNKTNSFPLQALTIIVTSINTDKIEVYIMESQVYI